MRAQIVQIIFILQWPPCIFPLFRRRAPCYTDSKFRPTKRKTTEDDEIWKRN